MEKASEKSADRLVPILHRHCWRVWALWVIGGPGCPDGRRCQRSPGSSPRLRVRAWLCQLRPVTEPPRASMSSSWKGKWEKKSSTSQEAVVHQLREWSWDCCINPTLLTNAHPYYFIKAVVRAGILVSLQNLPPPISVFLAVPEFLWTEKQSFFVLFLFRLFENAGTFQKA